MTQPTPSLIWMSLFVAGVLFGCAFIAEPLAAAFLSNGWFNAVILTVLAIGIAINVRQVLSLYPEIAWAEAWRSGLRSAARDAPQPRLLASMALMLSGRSDLSLSASSMRALLDAIRTRLEEARDLSRYVIGVLIFLGLLGTFWGLMATVGSIAGVIRGMAVEGADGALIFENLKQSLDGPLSGMGVAFSSSLFGLAGALILGFLDLQAAHAQNRFVNELEEWLSGSTRLSSGLLPDDGGSSGAPAYVEALLEKTADTLDRMQRTSQAEHAHNEHFGAHLAELAEALSRLNRLQGAHTEQFERIARSQDELAKSLDRLARRDTDTALNEDLRSELRLLSKTIANTLKARDGRT
ncbi:MAG: MotA/TolQ/ExbB proton channel family protein [Gammaproteobacteria bacterium]